MVEVQFDAYPLKNPRGDIYHVIPAEVCGVGLVERHDGRREAAFIRNHGAWLPPVFAETGRLD